MMPETKPLWYWDDSVKRYRSPETGRFIGVDDMNALRVEFMDSQKQRMEGVATVYSAGTIDIFTYEKQVKEILKQTYIDNYVMGAGGRNNMTQADWGSVGGMIHEQYNYLNPFLDQIARGELSQAQITARLRMYINSASEAFWRGLARDVPIDLPAYPGDGSSACLVNCQCRWDIQPVDGGYDCYWRLGEAEHCPDCTERAGKWNPYRIRITGEPSDKSVKYDPNQPRVPAGHSAGGQWTDGNLPSDKNVWDVRGYGSVPLQLEESEYYGRTRFLTATEYIRLVPPVPMGYETNQFFIDAIRNGEKIAPPILFVDWIEELEAWRVVSHEGRNRSTAFRELYGDKNMPVYIVFNGGIRATEVDDKRLYRPLLRQK